MDEARDDSDSEFRSRSCTWPMKRPNLNNRHDALCVDEGTSKMVRPNVEEQNLQDESMPSNMFSFLTLPDVQEENQEDFSIPSLFSYAGPSTNKLDELPCCSHEKPCSNSDIPTAQQQSFVCDAINNNYIKLEPFSQGGFSSNFCNNDATGISQFEDASDSSVNFTNGVSTCGDPLVQQPVVTESVSGTLSARPKTSSRKNAWGNSSYADLITQAIESAHDKRLTLAQIYDWMVKNIDYFKDKGDSNSAAGWKNSIRHNLSLHSKFKRVQNEGTGKSSWWVINYDAKPHKPNRRRTASLEASNSKARQSRAKALNRKNEATKKKNAMKKEASNLMKSPPVADTSSDFDRSFNSTYFSDFRTRTSSNASSTGGRLSPHRSNLMSDLEPEGPPAPSSPMASSYPMGNAFDFIGRNGDFNMMQSADVLPSADKLLEGMESMDILNPSSPMLQCSGNDDTSIYFTSLQGQQVKRISSSGNIPANNSVTNPSFTTLQNRSNQGSTPNIRLVAGKTNQTNKLLSNVDVSMTAPRQRANTMPKLRPQPKYKMSDIGGISQNGDRAVQKTIVVARSNPGQPAPSQNNFAQYQFNQSHQQFQQQPGNPQQYQTQQVYVQQQNNGNFYSPPSQQVPLNNPQIVAVVMQDRNNFSNSPADLQDYNQQPAQGQMFQQAVNQQQMGGSGIMPEQKYPSDLNSLDKKDIFNPGLCDFNDVLQGPNATDDFGAMDFNSFFAQDNLDNFRMDSGNLMSKFEPFDPSAFPYPSNQINANSNAPIATQHSVDQQQNAMKDMNVTGNGQMVALVSAPPNDINLNCASNQNLTYGDEMRGLSDRFAQPRQVKKQLSRGADSEMHQE